MCIRDSYYDRCAVEGANEHQIEESQKAVAHIDAIIGDPDRLHAVAEDFIKMCIRDSSYTDHHNIENAVLIGRVGAYCGSVYLEQGICWVSDNAIFAKSKITKDEFFDYFLLKRLNLFNHHVGTGQQLLTQEILNNIEVPKPVTEQIELFNRKAASVFETLFTNSREIIRLQELSDLLLSRLAG